MRSRGRSIRLRIYFLVAIPLITMLSLFAYTAYTSVTNFVDLDRAPGLVSATSIPLLAFGNLLQTERTAAVIYLSHPDGQSLAQYENTVAASKTGTQVFDTAMNSPGTISTADAQELAAIHKMLADINGNAIARLRQAVQAHAVSPIDAFGAYTNFIGDGSGVFKSQVTSLFDPIALSAGFGLISTINNREDVTEQAAMLGAALASGAMPPTERVVFDDAAGRQQDDTLLYTSLLTPAALAGYNGTTYKLASQSLWNKLTTIQGAIESGATVGQLEQQGWNTANWVQLTGALIHANYQGTLSATDVILDHDRQVANNAEERVALTGALGGAGLILTLIVTILLGRSIIRRLAVLRRSALTLAERQLPAVVARLRRGEDVNMAAEAPPLRAGADEIGQVGQAIDTVRQTAIRAAVEEANLRRGVNDVFRNLARRSQSLLQRQITVLDGMERSATDPDMLENLFKLDHLTTRMRRHAEGLIILSGAPPGRGWSSPVRLVDVMRGAVSEVEDYARVTVATQSRASVAGPAVTDVIHLLAELIENATTMSPPFTQVRMTGDIVANGFAIEIEDRGLGITPSRIAELNQRLANPPDINPTNTEQLGLFVVANLARRHGIRVMLQPSPYGGTTAVTLIPRRLIVDAGPAAITAGPGGVTIHGDVANGTSNGFGLGRTVAGGPGAAFPTFTAAGGESSPPPSPSRPTASHTPIGPPDLDNMPIGNSPNGLPPGLRISGPLRRANLAGSEPTRGDQGGVQLPRRHGGGNGAGGDVPVVTGVPVGRPMTPPPFGGTDQPFDAFAPQRQPEGYPNGNAEDTGPVNYKGLPRRVRQANLAPQLRSSPGEGADGTTGVPQAAAPSPTDVRNTLSAMQRGWQQGRSQSHQETEGSADGQQLLPPG
jgi:signal transduction histidine kinase